MSAVAIRNDGFQDSRVKPLAWRALLRPV